MDQDALVEALQAAGERDGSIGKLMLRGAALECVSCLPSRRCFNLLIGEFRSVTDPEPLPPNHVRRTPSVSFHFLTLSCPSYQILFSLDNCILTPHVSWASKGKPIRTPDASLPADCLLSFHPVNFLRAVELLGINVCHF